MTEATKDERLTAYAVAINDTGLVNCPEGAAGLACGDCLYEQHEVARAVMAVADAEHAELRRERVARIGDDSIRSMELKDAHRRAEAAEAEAKSLAELLGREILKVARVEALHVRDDNVGLCTECSQGFPCDTMVELTEADQ